jgi:lycopene cyclase domain-containing protein
VRAFLVHCRSCRAGSARDPPATGWGAAVSYSTLAVLAVVAVLVVDLAVYRTRMVTRPVFWVAYAIVVTFQLLMNGVLTGLEVVTYDPGSIWGPRIAYAPVEDLLFGFAMVTLTLASWAAVNRRANTARRRGRDTRTRRSRTR